jgi:MFS family permease
MMATGYYYNITFVQLGLFDLGTRLIGMSEQAVAASIACFALFTSIIALVFGMLMQQRGWSQQLIFKLRMAFVIALMQTMLTAAAPFIRSEWLFFAWIVVTSSTIGIGVPVTFSLAVDLIPVRDRGYVAAFITAAAYFFAAVFSSTWVIEKFTVLILGPMLAGTLTLAILAFKRLAFLDILAQQHSRPEFGLGRFARKDGIGRDRISRRMLVLIVLMFGIYFVDSLGFLRLIFTPVYVNNAWQSPQVGTLLFIGITHVVAALIAGVLYSALDVKALFLWVFGLFALVQLMYVFDTRLTPENAAPLVMPMLYATAVSLYTVVNFALWADLSTPRTIGRNAALGVALSGWTATFISTALAIQWRLGGVPLGEHLNYVASLAIVFLLVTLAVSLVQAWGKGRKP